MYSLVYSSRKLVSDISGYLGTSDMYGERLIQLLAIEYN